VSRWRPLPEGYPRCRPGGDRHLYLELGEGISPEINRWVHLTRDLLDATGVPGLAETTPAYSSLLVRYDPLTLSYDALAAICLTAARTVAGHGRAPRPEGAHGDDEAPVVVPVVYGGEWGPDLDDVASHAGIPPEEVARRHSGGDYRVYMMGFAPGFAYLGGMDPALATPRLARPRPCVPAGAVGIAGAQTGVYPADLPGGWRIIGRTPVRLWRPEDERPALLTPGHRVRFVDAGAGETGWARAVQMARRGEAGGGHARSGAHGASTEKKDAADAGASGGAVRVAVVRRPGSFDTVQDAGRWGFSHLGLPESGPLDWPAFRAANLAVGNAPTAAALEMTYSGPTLEFTRATSIAVGRGAAPRVNGSTVPTGEVVAVRAGDVLEFGRPARPRTYLAVAGGLAVPVVLGSRATYVPARLGGLGGRTLASGDELWAFTGRRAGPQPGSAGAGGGSATGPGSDRRATGDAGGKYAASGNETVVRAVPGPQHDLFPEDAVRRFFGQRWRVLESSDRRALMLDGDSLSSPPAGGVSDGTPAGAVQIPPSGRPVVLLADHQTIGGYPKIATVITPDLAVLAGAWPGDVVRFAAVDLRETQELWRRLPAGLAEGWPGGPGGQCGAGGGAAGGKEGIQSILCLEIGGRSHLVAVRQAPPRSESMT